MRAQRPNDAFTFLWAGKQDQTFAFFSSNFHPISSKFNQNSILFCLPHYQQHFIFLTTELLGGLHGFSRPFTRNTIHYTLQ